MAGNGFTVVAQALIHLYSKMLLRVPILMKACFSFKPVSISNGVRVKGQSKPELCSQSKST